MVPSCFLSIANCLLLIAYCLSLVACCLSPVAYCLLPIAYGLWPVAYGLWPIAHGVWPMAYGLRLLPIAYGLSPIAYCLLLNAIALAMAIDIGRKTNIVVSGKQPLQLNLTPTAIRRAAWILPQFYKSLTFQPLDEDIDNGKVQEGINSKSIIPWQYS